MSVRLTLDIPDSAFSLFRDDADHFLHEMRVAAAVKWFEMGTLSQSKAAELTEMSREDFLDALHKYGVSPFQTAPKDLAAELGDD